MQKFIIDRFEGSYAVCKNEDKSFSNIPKYKLPLDLNEGDCLIQGDDDIFRLELDSDKSTEE